MVPLMTAMPYVINVPFAPDMPRFEIPGLPYPVPSQRHPVQPTNNRRREETSNEDRRSPQRGEKDQMSETECADSSEDHAATTTDADKVVSYITQIFELSHV